MLLSVIGRAVRNRRGTRSIRSSESDAVTGDVVLIAGHHCAVFGAACVGVCTSQWFRDVISLEFWALFPLLYLSVEIGMRGTRYVCIRFCRIK